MEKIYRRCWKCGTLVWFDEMPDRAVMCTAPMAVRTSGICGGSYTEESTEEEFNKAVEEFEKSKK